MYRVAIVVVMTLLAGAEPVETPRKGCDVSATFKARQGKIDTDSFDDLASWLSVSADVIAVERLDRPDGGAHLCIMTKGPEIRTVFKGARARVERNFGGIAAVKIENRYGGLFEVSRFRGPSRAGTPYDNRYTGRPTRADIARMPRN